MSDIKKMNKNALEEYGRTVGIELDRRKTKKALIKDLEEHLAKSNATEEKGNTNVLLRDKNSGTWSEGPKPKGKKQHGTSRGVPYWEI